MTISLPNTFTGDTYLDSSDLQENFDTISAAINGGIASTDISSSAAFTLAQTAENNHRFFIDVAFYRTSSAWTVTSVTVPIMLPCELTDVSILGKKADATANDTEVSFYIKSGSNTLATVELSEADDKSGYYRFSPSIGMAAGFYAVERFGDIGNLGFVTVRLSFIAKHTKR